MASMAEVRNKTPGGLVHRSLKVKRGSGGHDGSAGKESACGSRERELEGERQTREKTASCGVYSQRAWPAVRYLYTKTITAPLPKTKTKVKLSCHAIVVQVVTPPFSGLDVRG